MKKFLAVLILGACYTILFFNLLCYADDVPRWTQCVDLTGKTCSQICAQQGMTCGKCTTSRGYEGWGAEAWPGGENCAGQGAGQTHCDFVGDNDPAQKSGIRWKCCCQVVSNFVERPLCHDSDDASGGVGEGGIKPHPDQMFTTKDGRKYFYSEKDDGKRGCESIHCREEKPWDQYYNNSGVYPDEKGKTWGNEADGTAFAKEDYCQDKNILIEYFCKNFYEDNTILGMRPITCSGGCEDGKCVGSSVKP